MAIETVLKRIEKLCEDGKERTDKAPDSKIPKRKLTRQKKEPYSPSVSNVIRFSKRVIGTLPNGSTEEYPSEKIACAAMFVCRGAISRSMGKGKPCAGRMWRYAK